MGACCSTPSLPEAADSGVNDASQLEDKKQQALFQHHSNSNPSGSLKQYTTRTTLSFEPTKTEECSCGGSALATPNMDNIMVEASVESLTPSFPQIEDNKSELTDFQLKMEMKKLEKLESRRRLEECLSLFILAQSMRHSDSWLVDHAVCFECVISPICAQCKCMPSISR